MSLGFVSSVCSLIDFLFVLFFFVVQVDPGAGSPLLALILPTVGVQGRGVHPGEDQLSHPASGLELDGTAVGVEEFQCDLPLEAGVHPARILDEQAHPPQGAAALYKGGQIVREDEVLHGGCQYKLSGQEDIGIALDSLIGDLLIHGDDPGGGILDHGKGVAQADVYAGGLDLSLFQRGDR